MNFRKLTNRAITGIQTTLEAARPKEVKRHPIFDEVDEILGSDKYSVQQKCLLLNKIDSLLIEATSESQGGNEDA